MIRLGDSLNWRLVLRVVDRRRVLREIEASRQGEASAVGRLQAAGVVVLVIACGLVAWVKGWPLALALAMAPPVASSCVIALELAFASMLSRRTCAGARRWAQTWWTEWWLNLKVFGWRQPFAWRQLPDTALGPSALAPVVFVHGYLCNRGFWLPWLRRCRAEGRPYVTVNLEPVFASIDAYVDAIGAAVHQAEAATGRRVLLVGHSMGGLAIRAWLAVQPQLAVQRVVGVVTIGTPHQGTWLARWSRTTNGQQMRLGSGWLAQLRERERAGLCEPVYARFLCWASATDNVVFPAETATLPGAENRWVESAGHIELAYLPEVISTSLAWMASADKSPADRTNS